MGNKAAKQRKSSSIVAFPFTRSMTQPLQASAEPLTSEDDVLDLFLHQDYVNELFDNAKLLYMDKCKNLHDPHAHYELGRIYHLGLGTSKQDSLEAFYHYKIAVDNNHPSALYMLCQLYGTTVSNINSSPPTPMDPVSPSSPSFSIPPTPSPSMNCIPPSSPPDNYVKVMTEEELVKIKVENYVRSAAQDQYYSHAHHELWYNFKRSRVWREAIDNLKRHHELAIEEYAKSLGTTVTRVTTPATHPTPLTSNNNQQQSNSSVNNDNSNSNNTGNKNKNKNNNGSNNATAASPPTNANPAPATANNSNTNDSGNGSQEPKQNDKNEEISHIYNELGYLLVKMNWSKEDRDYRRAIKYFKIAGDLGNSAGYYNIACRMYQNGLGVRKSQKIKNYLIRKSAEAGHPRAQLLIASRYDNYLNEHQPIRTHMSRTGYDYYFESCQTYAYSTTLFWLGWYYLNGKGGVERNVNKAVECFQLAAVATDFVGYSNGNSLAFQVLGFLVKHGIGLPVNLFMAGHYFTTAAKLQDYPSYIDLAKLIEKNALAASNIDIAVDFYQRVLHGQDVSAATVAHAQFRLGKIYRNHHYRQLHDEDKADRYFKLAYQSYLANIEKHYQGVRARHFYHIGVMYHYGYGVGASLQTAMAYYKKAILRGQEVENIYDRYYANKAKKKSKTLTISENSSSDSEVHQQMNLLSKKVDRLLQMEVTREEAASMATFMKNNFPSRLTSYEANDTLLFPTTPDSEHQRLVDELEKEILNRTLRQAHPQIITEDHEDDINHNLIDTSSLQNNDMIGDSSLAPSMTTIATNDSQLLEQRRKQLLNLFEQQQKKHHHHHHDGSNHRLYVETDVTNTTSTMPSIGLSDQQYRIKEFGHNTISDTVFHSHSDFNDEGLLTMPPQEASSEISGLQHLTPEQQQIHKSVEQQLHQLHIQQQQQQQQIQQLQQQQEQEQEQQIQQPLEGKTPDLLDDKNVVAHYPTPKHFYFLT